MSVGLKSLTLLSFVFRAQSKASMTKASPSVHRPASLSARRTFLSNRIVLPTEVVRATMSATGRPTLSSVTRPATFSASPCFLYKRWPIRKLPIGIRLGCIGARVHYP